MLDLRKWTVIVMTFSALIISVLGLVFLPRIFGGETYNLFLVAPAQVVLGSLAFLSGVTAIVAVFARLDLADKTKALGLPDGSVRALIALVLLVIFVIFANIIFGELTGKEPQEQEFDGLTAIQVAALPQVVTQEETGTLSDDTPTFSGSYLRPVDDGADELGQQIVTALITLVTAISAFYFGSGSVSAAVEAVTRVQGKGITILQPGQPFALSRGSDGSFAPVEIRLGGPSLRTAGVTASITGDDTGTVTAAGAADTFVYRPGTPTGPVTITFTALDGTGAQAELVLDVAVEPDEGKPPPPPA